MNDNKMKISQLIDALTRLKERKGDMNVRAVDEYGNDDYDIVLECGSGELIITSGPQM